MTLAHLRICGGIKATTWTAYGLLALADLRVACDLVPAAAVLTLATFAYDEYRRRHA